MPVWPGVEERDQPGLGDHLVERVVGAVVGPERLGVGVELEAAHAVSAIRRRASRTPSLPLWGSIARERDQHVRVRRGGLEHLLVADPVASHPGLVVDGEDDRHHRALAVVVGHLLRGRLGRLAAEVLRGRGEQLAGDRVLGLVGGALGVRVHVDRDDPLEVDATLSRARARRTRCRPAGARREASPPRLGDLLGVPAALVQLDTTSSG